MRKMMKAKKKRVISYKGFDKNLRCGDFQYDVGKEYEMDGEIKLCTRGFHASADPLDVLGYYYLEQGSRYCKVEQFGDIKYGKFNPKIVSSGIKIIEEIGIEGILKAEIKYIKGLTNKDERRAIDVAVNSSKDSAEISSIYDDAIISSSGNFSKIYASGNKAIIGSDGNYAKIVSTGDYSTIISGGECDTINTNGENIQTYSFGKGARINSSGFGEYIMSIGSDGFICSNGDFAMISAGRCSFICCTGDASLVRAGKGSWITLIERVPSMAGAKRVKTEYVDGKRIKADTWYVLQDGEFAKIELIPLTDEKTQSSQNTLE